MNIKVYRGANQIGGCITEISTEGCKILIDFGSNLPGSDTKELTNEQISKITANTDAIFYTHYHGDHTGLFDRLPKGKFIKQYIGEGAKEVMKVKYNTLRKYDDVQLIEQMVTYKAACPIDDADKGKIKVTPYFVSHSAFDSYMLKIECEGKIILHTGDFRKHGYLGKGLFPVLERYVKNVDILIIEGTMLGRRQENILTEHDIEVNTEQFLKNHKYVFALCSSTDMDRLASFHAACRKTHRRFVVDKYQNDVLEVFRKFAGTKSPLFEFKSYEFFTIPQRGFFTSPKILADFRAKGFLMPIRQHSIKMIKKLMSIYDDQPAWLIYSMWSGYTEIGKSYSSPEIQEIRSLFPSRIADGTRDGFYTSGHADIETLEKVCQTVNPTIGIIPIHKEKTAHFEDLPLAKDYRIFTSGDYTVEGINISVK